MKDAATLLAEDEARTTRALGTVTRQALAGRERRTGTSTFTEPAEWLMQVFGTQSKAGAIVNENSSLTVPTFAACVAILSSSMANLPLRLMQRTSKGAEPVDDNLSFVVGEEPNATQTSFRWRSFEMACLCLGGNGYTRIRRNEYFEPVALEPMLPFKTQPRVLQGSDYTGTIVYHYEGERLLPQDVLHFRGLSTDGFFGISPIRALRESLGLSLTMQEFTSRTFNNGNRQPGIFEGPPTMTDEKAKTFEQTFKQIYGGAQNAGKNPFIWGGVTWKNAGFTNQDAELLLNKKYEKSEIAGWFRIPGILVGAEDKASSWGTGIEQLMRGFVKFTLSPWATNLEQEMNFSLLSREQKRRGLFFRFDFSELLRGSPEEQANYLQKLWQVGAVSSNEVRRTFHMPEIADVPGDLRYVPANYLVAGAPRPEGVTKGVPTNAGTGESGTAGEN